MMALLQACLGMILVIWVRGDDTCPAQEQIAPCTCDAEGVNCMGVRSVEEVKKVFAANFKYGGVRAIWIQGTPITTIPGDLFGNIKTQEVYIEVNNVSSVDLKAFAPSAQILGTLSLFGNKLKEFDYSALSRFQRLQTLNLGRNEITSIPSSSFNSPTLGTIILAQNQISSIGRNAFGNLPNLMRLEIALNQLKTIGPMALAFTSHSAALTINLAGNQIESVASDAFEGADPAAVYLSHNRLTSLPYDPFGNLVTRIANKGGILDLSANPLSCRGCDYSWIVNNKDLIYTRLVGFQCTDGRSILDLTRSLIQCNSK